MSARKAAGRGKSSCRRFHADSVRHRSKSQKQGYRCFCNSMFERPLAEVIVYITKPNTDEILFRNSPCLAEWSDLHHAFPGSSSLSCRNWRRQEQLGLPGEFHNYLVPVYHVLPNLNLSGIAITGQDGAVQANTSTTRT